MQLTPEQIASVCHEANRALQGVHGEDAMSPPWEEAPAWQRESAVDGVVSALKGATPEELHESWCAYKRAEGWTYGPVKDAAALTHPCLVDYDELPVEQRIKDDLFAGIVDALGETPDAVFDPAGRAFAVTHMMRYFDAGHLPEHLALVSSACRSLAVLLATNLPDNPELTAGLRKLLEAKDCFVRAAL